MGGGSSVYSEWGQCMMGLVYSRASVWWGERI